MAKKKENELALPDDLQMLFEDDPEHNDLENVAEGEQGFPKLLLLQALSPMVVDGHAKMGQIANLATSNVIMEDPNDPLEIIPLYYWRSRIFMSKEGERLCHSFDCTTGHGSPGGTCVSCEMSKWDNSDPDNGIPPKCDTVHNWPILLPEHYGRDRVMILSMKRTQYKVGKIWNQKLSALPGRIFTRKYRLTSFIEKGGAHPFANFKFESWPNNRVDEIVKDPDLLMECLTLSKKFEEEYKAGRGIKTEEPETVHADDIPF